MKHRLACLSSDRNAACLSVFSPPRPRMATGSKAEKSPEVKKDKKRPLHAVYRVGDLDRTIKCYT
ncbi:hypothetical protein ABZP36_006051 [Zizania latifolia]